MSDFRHLSKTFPKVFNKKYWKCKCFKEFQEIGPVGFDHYQYQLLFPVIYEDWSVIVLYRNNGNENLSVRVKSKLSL